MGGVLTPTMRSAVLMRCALVPRQSVALDKTYITTDRRFIECLGAGRRARYPSSVRLRQLSGWLGTRLFAGREQPAAPAGRRNRCYLPNLEARLPNLALERLVNLSTASAGWSGCASLRVGLRRKRVRVTAGRVFRIHFAWLSATALFLQVQSQSPVIEISPSGFRNQ